MMRRSVEALASGRPVWHRPSCFDPRNMGFRPRSRTSFFSPDTHFLPRPAGSFVGVLQPPNFVRCPSRSITSIPEIEGQKSTLVTGDDGNILEIPTGGENDFGRLRKAQGAAYFDRTKYISILEHTSSYAVVFLRPRRFGKSLALSMLQYFHDVNAKEQYQLLFKVCSFCVIPICFTLPKLILLRFRVWMSIRMWRIRRSGRANTWS